MIRGIDKECDWLIFNDHFRNPLKRKIVTGSKHGTEAVLSGGPCFGYLKYPSNIVDPVNKSFVSVEKSFDFTKDLLEKKTIPSVQRNFIFPDKKKYLHNVQALKHHIQIGDIYEVNYCVEFSAEDAVVDPASLFLRLDAISNAPHACFAKFGSTFVICSSPERFLMKRGNKLITQPIKGTAPRGKTPVEDQRHKNELLNSLKEKTENVMIVDVARNDLSRIAKKGTVTADELFGIYSFEQVHQMISTVSCELCENISFDEIIDATFPMASMTGAPKIRAMQLINEYEDFDRGFYSGSIGRIDSSGDFDFNVVIRSIIYDERSRRISFAVGSAITAMSDPEQEWEECMIKAKAMLSVLGAEIKN